MCEKHEFSGHHVPRESGVDLLIDDKWLVGQLGLEVLEVDPPEGVLGRGQL